VVAFARQYFRVRVRVGVPLFRNSRAGAAPYFVFGILGALIFRGIFIVLGAALLQYGWIVILFGVFLILTGVRMIFSAERQVQPEHSPIVRGLRRLLPVATESEGSRSFLRRNGKLFVTPILLALAFIEATDILFALDSVPAIFAITRERLVVYMSNVFAILGLRAMYFLLAGALASFHLLRYGLALIRVNIATHDVFEASRAAGGILPPQADADPLVLQALVQPRCSLDPIRQLPS
jgi:TerC family integral membrane protein